MAAICLTVEGSVKDAFQAAQDDRSIRSLSLSISIADEAITLTSTIPCSSSVSADFEALSATLEEAQPQFIAFCVDDDANNGAAATARARPPAQVSVAASECERPLGWRVKAWPRPGWMRAIT